MATNNFKIAYSVNTDPEGYTLSVDVSKLLCTNTPDEIKNFTIVWGDGAKSECRNGSNMNPSHSFTNLDHNRIIEFVDRNNTDDPPIFEYFGTGEQESGGTLIGSQLCGALVISPGEIAVTGINMTNCSIVAISAMNCFEHLSEFTFGNCPTAIKEGAFAGMQELTHLGRTDVVQAWCDNCFNGANLNLDSYIRFLEGACIQAGAFSNLDGSPISVSFGNDVELEQGAFFGSTLARVDRIDTISSIPPSCFQEAIINCNIVLGKNANTEIYNEAFKGSAINGTVTFRDGVLIGRRAFEYANINGLKRVDTIQAIAPGAFAYITSPALSTFTLGAATILTKDYEEEDIGVFFYNTALKEVTFLGNRDSLPTNMFSYCANLSAVKRIDTIGEIKDRVFHDCDSITDIRLKKDCIVGGDAFYNCDKLSCVTFGNDCVLSTQCFADCASLYTLKRFDTALSVDPTAFGGETPISAYQDAAGKWKYTRK